MLYKAIICLAISSAFSGKRQGLTDKHDSCVSWAEAGECAANARYMQENCAKACSEAVPPSAGEPEQCAGWASQGECTRNPKYMMYTCPQSCAEQRKSVHEGLLDSRGDCLDLATAE
eukprot:5751390-Prymnesium_polylepis.1